MAKNKDEDLKEYFKNPKKRNGRILSKLSWKHKLIILGVLLIAAAAFMYYVISGLPSLEQLENPKPQLASTVYTSDGEVLGQFYIENRIETHLDSLPNYLTNALISTEDRKFYSHWGVDLDRFAKAMVKNVLTFSHEGAHGNIWSGI